MVNHSLARGWVHTLTADCPLFLPPWLALSSPKGEKSQTGCEWASSGLFLSELKPLSWLFERCAADSKCRPSPLPFGALVKSCFYRHSPRPQVLTRRHEEARGRLVFFFVFFFLPSCSGLQVSWLVLTRSAWPAALLQASGWRSSCCCWKPEVSRCPAAKDCGSLTCFVFWPLVSAVGGHTDASYFCTQR